jgi:hypothetical protein
MADKIPNLQAAEELILKLQGDVSEALKLAENAEAESKKLAELNKELSAELSAARADSEKKIQDLQTKLAESQEAQKDFDKKVEEKSATRAAEITASVGVPPISITPSSEPTPEDVEKKKIAGLFGIEKVTAVFEAKAKSKK